MPETIPLQDSVVYGPIHSRRLGASLGINILPLTRKVCASNCVYCQYGWTVPSSSGERLPRAPQLLAEMEQAFQRHVAAQTRVDCVTFAGNGEPTIHPDLLELVIETKRLRDRYFPRAQVGILSDATQLGRGSVREAMRLLDVRYLKFDAADEATWRRINLPLGRLSFDEFLRQLQTLPDIVLQSLFMQGTYDNTNEVHLAAWVEQVRTIRPRSVQVYTTDRGTAAAGITEVPRATLQAIADRLVTTTGIPADVYD